MHIHKNKQIEVAKTAKTNPKKVLVLCKKIKHHLLLLAI